MTNFLQLPWSRTAAVLGCPHAILGGAMSWVSESNRVAAPSNVGAFGVIAASSMPPHLLSEEFTELAMRALHTAYGLDAA